MRAVDERQRCAPLLTSWAAETTCFWPDEVQLAEACLAFVPVTPCAIVQKYTALPLTQVLIRRKSGLVRQITPPRTSIIYIFGAFDSLPPAPGGRVIPSPAPPDPAFVVVQEEPGPWEDETGLRQQIWYQGKGTSLAGIRYGNWSFCGGVPGNREHVIVTANVDPEVLEAMGRTLVGGNHSQPA